MIIHSTFTNGYFNYAKFFLSTFKRLHGQSYKIVFTATDLKDQQVENLHNIYSNLDVFNNKFDYTPFCDAMDLRPKEARALKHQVEHNKTMVKHARRTKWKMHVAAEKRVMKDIPFVMRKYRSEGTICHFDIDMYFRKKLDRIFKIVDNNDFSTIYRPDDKDIWRRTWICIQGVKTNKNGFKYYDYWGKILEAVPLSHKPFGFGQISCWLAWEGMKEQMRLGNIPEEGFVVDAKRADEDCLIWSANNPRGGNKDETLRYFRDDFYGPQEER